VTIHVTFVGVLTIIGALALASIIGYVLYGLWILWRWK
jgi:hypothetical protein